MANGPHQGKRVVTAGTPLEQAKAATILVHGRGATAESILTLSQHFGNLDGIALLAPQAAMNTWYPNSFLAPLESNQPGLDSGLQAIADIVAFLMDEHNIPSEKVMILGFSQGACLALEFGARNAQRFGGLVALSGGLVGPDGTPRDYPGDFGDTPIFLGCSDVDFHIPLQRVKHSTEVLGSMGASVEERIYPGMGHTVNDDEIAYVREMVQALKTDEPGSK